MAKTLVCTAGCERLRLVDRCVRCNPGYSDNRQNFWIYSEQKRNGGTREQAEQKYLAQSCTGCGHPGTAHPAGDCPGKAAGSRFTPPSSTEEPSRSPRGTSTTAARKRQGRQARTDAVPTQPDQPVVTVGGTQFAFSDQPSGALSRRAAADPLPQGRTTPRSSSRRSVRPTNGTLVQVVATLAVAAAGFMWGWVAAVCVLGLLVVATGLRRWPRREQAAAPHGHLTTVDNDGMPVSTSSGWVRR